MVWLDAEMTGLYPGVDALVEVAILITDADKHFGQWHRHYYQTACGSNRTDGPRGR